MAAAPSSARKRCRDVNPTGGAANCNTTANGAPVSCQTGYIGGIPYYGRDLNGDGDLLDTVRVLAPSQTQTDRYGVIAGLRYDINDDHTVRVTYSLIAPATARPARPTSCAPTVSRSTSSRSTIRSPTSTATSCRSVTASRSRCCTRFGGEYRGEFGRLTVNVGVRAPFFKRDLTNNCATSSVTGFVECFGTNAAGLAAWLANNPTVPSARASPAPVQGPQQRIRKYNKFRRTSA